MNIAISFASLRSKASKRSRAGFTLIELMVVVVILATLVGLGIIGVTRVLKNAEKSKRNACAELIESAIMAYKNEHGAYPLGEQTYPNVDVLTFGNVNNNRSANETKNPCKSTRPKCPYNACKLYHQYVGENAEIVMLLLGRDVNGKRDDAKRAYLTDSSMLYVCKGGRRVSKLDDALAGGGVSASDVIGFLVTMNKTGVNKYKRLSQARVFAPLKITYNFDVDHYVVTVPNEESFSEVIQLN